MATAGSIVLDLLMKTGSFETDVARASRVSQKRLKEIEKQAQETAAAVTRSLSNLFSGALFGVGVGTVFSKFIEESKNAQNEQAQLAAALKSTGEAAGYSISQLNKMATEFSGASVFSEGDINRAQTRLLSYTGIVGEEFPRALQAVIDTASRMGMTVEQAAETVGRALDVPSAGLSSLSKQGFRFTEDQKKLVEQLEKTGKTAEAQGIILSALESSYGGAAKAARDTLGGAMQALRNQIDNLMTGDDGSVNGLTTQVNDLTDLLGSPEVKQAFADFTSWLASVSSALVTAAADFAEGMRAAGGFVDALFTYGAMNPFNSHAENAAKYRRELEELDAFEKRVLAGEEQNHGVSISGKRQQLLNRIAFSERKANAQERDVFAAYAGVGETGADVPVLTPIATKGTPPGGDNGKKRIDEGQKLIDQMNLRIALIGKETEYEKLLAQISTGSIKFRSDAQKEMALTAAKDLDARVLAYDETKKQAESLKSLIDDLYPKQAKTDQYLAQLTVLSQAFYDGKLNAEQYADAAERLEGQFEQTSGEMGEFAKEAARGIQNSLGDGLYQMMQGNFDNIGMAWLQMLQKMAADALAAQLAKKLFGDYDSGGGIGGLFGALFSGLGGAGGSGIGAATAADVAGAGGGLMFLDGGGYTGPGGKYDVAGIVHAGEYVINADATRKLGTRFLSRLNGYAEGGLVGPALAGPGALDGGGLSLVIENHGLDIEVQQARERQFRIVAKEEIAQGVPGLMAREQANPNSRFSRQQTRSTDTQRKR
ncbi:phage tail length tape measure family protein [Achromobacter pestifer]